MYKIILLLCFSFCIVLAKHEEYDGHILYQVEVDNIEETQEVNRLASELDLDVWSHALPLRPGEVLVPKEKKEEFQNALTAAGVEFKVEVQNIKEKLELEDELLAAASRQANRSGPGLPFNTIHRYAVVDAYLVDLANRYPNIVQVVSGGRSFQGRDIKYLKISTTNFQDPRKPIVAMESLLHAREWVTLPATLYAIEKLVLDVTEQDLLRNVDWIIVPIANPDGYEHSHTSARFWRKNRATGYTVGNTCIGVDLNRNFDFRWGTSSSSSVCSETFHGRGPFSEPEAAVIRNIILEHRDRIEVFLDIHSFGSWILYGFGNGTLPPNGLTIHLVGVQMANAIDAVKWPSNRNYVVGNSALLLYSTSGSAQDYAQLAGASLSYTYELPAYNNLNNLNGFLVHPDFIEQAGYETWQGIKAGARYAVNNYRKRFGK